MNPIKGEYTKSSSKPEFVLARFGQSNRRPPFVVLLVKFCPFEWNLLTIFVKNFRRICSLKRFAFCQKSFLIYTRSASIYGLWLLLPQRYIFFHFIVQIQKLRTDSWTDGLMKPFSSTHWYTKCEHPSKRRHCVFSTSTETMYILNTKKKHWQAYHMASYPFQIFRSRVYLFSIVYFRTHDIIFVYRISNIFVSIYIANINSSEFIYYLISKKIDFAQIKT